MKRALQITGTGVGLLVGLLPTALFTVGVVGFLILEIPIRLIAALFGVHTGPADGLWWPRGC